MSDSNCSNITNTNTSWAVVEDCECDKCVQYIRDILDNLSDIPRLNVKMPDLNCPNITNTNTSWADVEDCECDKCVEFISSILDNLPDIYNNNSLN
jgi:hypothetical protein